MVIGFDRCRRFGWVAAAIAVALTTLVLVPAVLGQESGHSGHSGRGGGHDAGHDSGSHEEGHGSGRGRGRGSVEGHIDHSFTGRGGGRAVRDEITGSGRPVWAAGGIPRVELGRLNVARAPSQVLDRARLEAIAETTGAVPPIFTMSATDAAALLSKDSEAVARLHSPMQNLALYRELMVFGSIGELNVHPASRLDLAAILLGSAANRELPVSGDTVQAVNAMLGLIELPVSERDELAGKADAIRRAMVAGHGEEHTDDHGGDVHY